MKKKFKSILLFSSILGVAAITTGAITLTSCGSNVEDSVGGSGDQGSQLPPNNNQTGEGNSGSDSNTQVTPPSQQPQNPILKPDQDQTPPSDTGTTNPSVDNQEPIVMPAISPEQREIIAKSPSLSYLYDTNRGARFILNEPNKINETNINTDVTDSNVHDLLTLCGFKSNMDPFLDNAYFADALTFTKADVKAAEETQTATKFTILEDSYLAKNNVSFYLYKESTTNSDTAKSNVILTNDEKIDASVNDQQNWILLGNGNQQEITLEEGKPVYIAVSFPGKITDYKYDVPQLFAENSDNSISSEYTFKNIKEVVKPSESSRDGAVVEPPAKKLNENIFLYELNKNGGSKAIKETSTIPNKIELVLKKTDEAQAEVKKGWNPINPLTEGTIEPKSLQKEGSLPVGINEVVKAYTYTVLDKDTTKYTGYSAESTTPTVGSTSGEKWFKIDDQAEVTKQFSTNVPSLVKDPINPTKEIAGINLYFLYTNGNNIDLNQLDVKTGTKLLLINNNPNKVSKVVCSNNFLEYGKGHTNGLQFNVGSSLGWYGRFEFTRLIKDSVQTKPIVGNPQGFKNFIFTHSDRLNYYLSTFSLSSLALEPTNKNL